MKKLLFSLLMPFITSLCFGQLLTEGFDDITTLEGNGWIMTNQSNPIGTSDWFQGNSTVFSGHQGGATSYIGANYNNTAGAGTISNWLIFPTLSLKDGDQLKFWTRVPTGGNSFPDRLEVRASTGTLTLPSGATSEGSFTNLLLSINESLGNSYPETWTEYTVTLSGIGNTPVNVNLAFRYYVTNGGPSGSYSNYIGIDTLSVIRPDEGGGDECAAVNPPYFQNFETASAPDMPECTTVENAGTGNNWQTYTGTYGSFTGTYLRYAWNTTNPANTWFYTQALNLTAGVTYKVKYDYGSASSSSFPESLRVAYGTNNTHTAMTTILADHPTILTDSQKLTNEVEFTPETSGVYYIGFQAYSAANMFYLFLDNISVELVDGGGDEGCLDAPNGQYPSATYTPNCTGAPENISTLTWTGEYSMVSVTAGTTYIFSSSVPTDFVTISDENGTVVYAAGTTPVTWTATANELIRFYLHFDSDCNWADSGLRSRIVQCGDILPPPDNDDCEDAIEVSCGETVTGSTANATNSGGNAAADVFYKYTAGAVNQYVTASLCGSSYDTAIRVFTDCTLANEVAFNDDSCGLQSEVTFLAEANTTYLIMVEGYSSNTGDYTMTVTCDDIDGYCEPFLDCTDGDLITNVTFQEINNTTSCSPNGYGDYTHLSATVEAGNSYQMSVTVGSGWTYESVMVWVDYNNNFIFEPSEYTFIGSDPGTTNTGTITIPSGTPDGVYRMRVRVGAVNPDLNDLTIMACDEDTVYGEVEDYTLIVGAGGSSSCSVEYDGTFQDGLGNMQTLLLANDFPVGANTEMKVQKVTLNIFGNISSGDVHFFNDLGGMPNGNEASFYGLTPASQTLVGSEFGFNIYEVVFELPSDVVLNGGATGAMFWVGVQTTAGSEGVTNYWEAADSVNGEITMVSTDGGATWSPNSFGQDGAFIVEGECSMLGIDDLTSFDFAYYPNPVRDVLNIKSQKGIESVTAFNLAGQQVMKNANVSEGQINVSTLPAGTYVFRVVLQGGQVETFKIIKK